jgi:hypothetical protein
MKKSIKIVKESIDETPVNETVKYGGHAYDIFKIGGETKVFAGQEGLLGKDGQLISWDIVKKLMQKLGIK